MKLQYEKTFIYFHLNSKFLCNVLLILIISQSQFCYLIFSIILFKLQVSKYLNLQANNIVCFQQYWLKKLALERMSCEGFLIAFKDISISHAPKCKVNSYSCINHVYTTTFFVYLSNKLGSNLIYKLKLDQTIIGF